MIDEKQVSDDEPRQAALPQSASVMWDLSLKRYDVFRSVFETLCGRAFALLAASQALITAHALVLVKLAPAGRGWLVLLGLVSAGLYLGGTVASLRATRLQDINPLPDPTLPEISERAMRPREYLVGWLVYHHVESKVNYVLESALAVRALWFQRALGFAVAQVIWLFLLTIVPICIGIVRG